MDLAYDCNKRKTCHRHQTMVTSGSWCHLPACAQWRALARPATCSNLAARLCCAIQARLLGSFQYLYLMRVQLGSITIPTLGCTSTYVGGTLSSSSSSGITRRQVVVIVLILACSRPTAMRLMSRRLGRLSGPGPMTVFACTAPHST